MSMPSDSLRTMEEAATLVEQVMRTLAEGDAQLRAMGLDPEKVRAMGQNLSPEQQRKADAALQADLAAIDQTVAEERARQSVNRPGPAVSRRPQRFV